MSTARQRMLGRLSTKLGPRSLVYFGTRGDDADAISDVPNFSGALSVISPYTMRGGIAGRALENFSGLRVDLDAHDIDEEPHSAAVESLRRELLAQLGSHSAVFTYRPSTFLSAATFARHDSTLYLGMFKDHQSAFEHKPWVEAAVRKMDLPRVPWTYVSEGERGVAAAMLRDGPLVLRRSRGSGGSGIVTVATPEELNTSWPAHDEALVSVAPYLTDVIPLNISAVAWDDGVTIHHLSVQLIGITSLTHRPFGYCGNDFGLARDLDSSTVLQVELSVRRLGDWLRRLGYRGAFGVDFLVRDGTPLFTEINPRFQGSTHLTCHLSRAGDESCLMTDHLAAQLHLPLPTSRPSLQDRCTESPDIAHLVAHWPRQTVAGLDVGGLVRGMAACSGFGHADVLLPKDVASAHGATLGRFTMNRRVTQSGFDLDSDIASAVSAFFTVPGSEGHQ